MSEFLDPLPCQKCGASRAGFKTRSGRCRDCDRQRILRYRAIPCAGCSEPIQGSRSGLPQGQAMCQPCRRARREAEAKALLDRRLSQRNRPVEVPYRKWAKKASSGDRGYGSEHRNLRQYLLSVFADGTPCPRCDEPMLKDQPLDLDHTDDRTGYLGLSHRRCNRRTNVIAVTPPRCAICGDEFPYRRDQRTCSRSCGGEMRRRAA